VTSHEPLLDGGGHHISTLAAFLTALPVGTHTVEIRGGLFGAGVRATYPFSFLKEDFVYTVVVRPGH
jgi:hypothetical protein